MTDSDTLANAGELWELVHLVQDTIDKDGSPLIVDEDLSSRLQEMRRLADEADPDNGRF